MRSRDSQTGGNRPPPPDEHVGEWLADYVFQRLDETRARRVEGHVAGCEECAEDLAWVYRVMEARGVGAVTESEGDVGDAHLDATRIVLLADGEVASASEQRHLETCDSCARELEVLRAVDTPEEVLRAEVAHRAASEVAERRSRGSGASGLPGASRLPGASPLPGASRLPGASPSPVASRRRRRAAPAAVALFALAAVLLLMVRPWGSDLSRLPALSVREPLPVRITRTVAEPGSFEAFRQQGLEAYRDGEYETAVGSFAEALRLEPRSAEMWLYRGSAELMLDRTEDAATHLRRAVELAGDPGLGPETGPGAARVDEALRDEARWQRVQVLLIVGDGDFARELLDLLVEGGGHRASDAQALRASLPAASRPAP